MDSIYHRFFNLLPIHSVATDDDLHLLNADELALIRKTERWTMAAGVLVELLAYLVIFLPIYEFPALFEARGLTIGGPFQSLDTPILLVRDGWMLLVTLAELYLLLLVNLAAVHGVAVATGYIHRETRAAHAPGLIEIALERRSHDQRTLGIDPFAGVQPWVLYLFLLLNRLKGLIGNALIRAALTNLFGREILRVYLDFSGMPLYMAINVYTTRVILRNARVVVMGQTSIDLMLRQLEPLRLDASEKALIYDTLQYIAINKRDFHANHHHLARAVLKHYEIPVEPCHPLPDDFLEKLERARAPLANVCRRLIILGFILDGHVSWRERRELRRLRARGIVEVSERELETFRREFVDGQGFSALVERDLGPS